MRTSRTALLALLTVCGPLAVMTGSAEGATAPATATAPEAAVRQQLPGSQLAELSSRRLPRLDVKVLVRHLDHPWDVQPIGRRRLLITQRDRARLTLWHRGARTPVAFPRAQVWRAVETGLMGLAIDPDYATNHRFYTCQGGYLAGGGHDVRVVAWRLDAGPRATYLRTLVGGFPTTTGRHGGCRLLIAADGSLLVGTGDAAVGTNPQDLGSFGGKTLRLDRLTGAPWPTNRWAGAADRTQRYVDTYGHRNVQGLAQRADGTLWSVEQGTNRDDEVNLLVPGGNYGWNPVPGYDESTPMTDQSLPGTQLAARWSSGYPTIATSGATFVQGPKWGRYEGTLAVAALKAERIVFMKFDARGRLLWTRAPRALRGTEGRLRSVTRARNNDLLITTDNGDGHDRVLRVSPR